MVRYAPTGVSPIVTHATVRPAGVSATAAVIPVATVVAAVATVVRLLMGS